MILLDPSYIQAAAHLISLDLLHTVVQPIKTVTIPPYLRSRVYFLTIARRLQRSTRFFLRWFKM